MTKHRSAGSLLASGVATINLHQRLRLPKVQGTAKALETDRKAIMHDGRKALRAAFREHGGA